jgi:hypothetical protein
VEPNEAEKELVVAVRAIAHDSSQGRDGETQSRSPSRRRRH